MQIRSLFIAIFLFLGSSVYAQSYYEMLCYISIGLDKFEFKTFLLINGDGTGKMRLHVDKKPTIECTIKQNFYSDKDNKTDYTKMYYKATNFKYVEGDINSGVAADLPPFITFWFKINPQTNEFEPWAFMTINAEKGHEGEDLQGVISSIRLLESKDFTPELILTYFTEDEDIYKNLFVSNIRTVPAELKASRMFLLTVADTEDENIGPDCDTDRKKQQAYFKKIADKLGIEIIITELVGKDLSKTNLLNKINAIQPARNDIVIFHYSGHGYSKADNRQYPYLDLRYDKDIPVKNGDELNIEEIYEMITNKPGRLNLVISDCCNWHLDITNMKSINIATPRPSSVGLSLENMQSLFMNPNRTSLMITAAAKGQVSAGNAISGGIFTSQFRESLQKYMGINYQHITWEQITQNTKTQTETVAGYSLCPKPENANEYNKCNQTPVFKMN